MIYCGILFFLIIFSFITNRKDNYLLLVFFSLFYFFFLALRFGQGTDYFNYKTLYFLFPKDYNHFFINSYKNSVEPFFYVLNIFAKRNNLGFQFVIIVTSLICVFFSFKIIQNFSSNKIISVLIMFTNYFFYYQCAIRQAVAMTICCYGLLSYLYDRKIMKYYLFILLSMMFHTAAIIGFLAPVIIKLNIKGIMQPVTFIFYSFICIGCSLFLPKIIIKIVSLVIPKYAYYNKGFSVNIGAIGLRVVLSLLAIYISRGIKKGTFDYLLLKIYLISNLMFLCFSSISIFSRLTDFFTFLEVILFANIIKLPKKNDLKISFCLILLLYSFLFIKDIGAAMKQDYYYSNKFYEYPYVSIFNKYSIEQHKEIKQALKPRLVNEE